MKIVRGVGRRAAGEGIGDLVRRPTPLDVALFLLLLAMVFVIPRSLLGGNGAGTTLEANFSLLEDGIHPLRGPLGEANLIVSGGQARLENSPCPLKIGEAMGPVSKPGDVILCIPNRISIRVKGEVSVDAVSR